MVEDEEMEGLVCFPLSSSLMVASRRERMESKRITGSREDFLFWKEDF